MDFYSSAFNYSNQISWMFHKIHHNALEVQFNNTTT